MIHTVLWWATCVGLAAIGAIAVVVAGERIRAVVEQQDRAWQETHWARQTAHLSHPETCPRHVIEWLSEPLVPTHRLGSLPVLSFQRCALAFGHDPARVQQRLLSRLQTSRRTVPARV